jgi:dipeptidyl aminopeptidase/acylaminoacyl peptidase
VYSSYVLSADGEWILFATQWSKVYRHSSEAVYHAFNIAARTFVTIDQGARLQDAQWAPSGHRLSYVKENNLHIFWLDAGEAQNVTRDGLRNHVINGNTHLHEAIIYGCC